MLQTPIEVPTLVFAIVGEYVDALSYTDPIAARILRYDPARLLHAVLQYRAGAYDGIECYRVLGAFALVERPDAAVVRRAPNNPFIIRHLNHSDTPHGRARSQASLIESEVAREMRKHQDFRVLIIAGSNAIESTIISAIQMLAHRHNLAPHFDLVLVNDERSATLRNKTTTIPALEFIKSALAPTNQVRASRFPRFLPTIDERPRQRPADRARRDQHPRHQPDQLPRNAVSNEHDSGSPPLDRNVERKNCEGGNSY